MSTKSALYLSCQSLAWLSVAPHSAWKQVNEFVHEVTLGPESEGRKLVGFSEESAFPVIIDE